MKAALLSFHNAYNYGAALQAYALQRAVEELGAECEYINYQNDHRRHAYDLKYQFVQALKERKPLSATKALAGMPVLARRGRKFRRFFSRHLKTTAAVIDSPEKARALNGRYDKFIVGSDQVWNYTNNGGDTAYLLDFVEDDSRKISYSSSFGASRLAPEAAAAYAPYLGRFNRLSTRESVGVEIIETLTGRKAHLVLDPVFLTGRDEWERIRADQKRKEKPYIFFYTNRQSQIRDFLNTGYAFDGDYHVLSTHLSVKDMLNRRIRTRVSMSPEEFLKEIRYADLVVTASFHCLALAIVFHKPFTVILTGNHGKDERILNLLRITGLEDRILNSGTSGEDVCRPIDYAEADRRLAHYLDDSREYLRRALFDETDIPFDTSLQNRFFCRDSRCTGCGACAAVCPAGAIAMRPDRDGFMVPVMDEGKCVSCYRCHAACQVYDPGVQPAGQRFYAVRNTDEVRKASSSGGMFHALARRIFAEGGVVCAAGMDRNYHVSHRFAVNENELAPMRGTYYVQSAIGDSYARVRECLEKGEPVLFTGTACQVRGLQKYLGREYDRLMTCDILCHGAPSPAVFEQFIAFLGGRDRVTDFRFRNKELGWRGYHVSAVIDGKFVSDSLWLQSFNNLFSHNMINRLSCGECAFANYSRCGDITIGDFWGLERTHPELCDPLGVSLVITNTEKGEHFFRQLELRDITEVKREETVQRSLTRPSPASSRRTQVFQSLRMKDYRETAKQYAEVGYGGWVKNILRKAYNGRH